MLAAANLNIPLPPSVDELPTSPIPQPLYLHPLLATKYLLYPFPVFPFRFCWILQTRRRGRGLLGYIVKYTCLSWLPWLPQLPWSLRPSDPPGMGYIVKYSWLRWLPQLPRSLRPSDPPGMGYIVKYTCLSWLPWLPRSLRPSDHHYTNYLLITWMLLIFDKIPFNTAFNGVYFFNKRLNVLVANQARSMLIRYKKIILPKMAKKVNSNFFLHP